MSQAMSPQMRAMLDKLDEVAAIAAQYEADDMLVYGADLHARPKLIEGIQQVIVRLSARGAEAHPVHPAVVATDEAIAATLSAAVGAAEQVGQAFEALHYDEIQRALHPRVNEHKWHPHRAA